MTSILLLVFFVCGALVGYFYRDIRDKVEKLITLYKEREPEIGATHGIYAPVNEQSRVNQDGQVGLVEAKTPQRVEFDIQEELERNVKEMGRR